MWHFLNNNAYKVVVPALALLLFLLHSCDKEWSDFSISFRALNVAPEGFPPIPFPEDNQFDMDRWELGKKLFYDPILSRDSSISCASCHIQKWGFADNQSFSPGINNRPGVRNAPSLANIAYQPYLLREGGVPTLEMQILVPIQEANEFDHDILAISEKLNHDSSYVNMSQKAYQRNPDPFVITRAIATFERTLISGNSSFDQYFYQGKSGILSEETLKGMVLFNSEKTSCSSCHGGFNFTDYTFQNNGLDTVYKDIGRMRLTGKEEDESLFKVPSLRNVALTAPYMHNGQFNTIEEVIDHYNSGGKMHKNKSPYIRPLNLSSAEKYQLSLFLHSLTDVDFVTRQEFQ